LLTSLDVIALVLSACVLAAALGALTARSLFSMAMLVAAVGAMAAAALAAQGAVDAALAQAFVGAALAPFVILACLLLSTRATKPRRSGRPWLTMAGGVAVAAALIWLLPDISPRQFPPAIAGDATMFWLAPLMFVAVAAAAALLGYGERGALQRPLERDE
jgi:uncharacterized MnhB-related membrane protein